MARTVLTESDRAEGATLGHMLRSRRDVLGLSREHVARHADVSVETLRKAERGQSPGISFLVIRRVSRVLEMGLDDLAGAISSASEETDRK